jgi:hypothetical protein
LIAEKKCRWSCVVILQVSSKPSKPAAKRTSTLYHRVGTAHSNTKINAITDSVSLELELELIHTQMAQKLVLRAEFSTAYRNNELGFPRRQRQGNRLRQRL